MTRFDAAEPAARRKLYVDSITAHRTRASGFVTFEVDEEVFDSDAETAESDGDNGAELDPDLGVPWLQFGDGTVNLDCTETELDRLKELLNEFPVFKIEEVVRPDEAEGVNVRVSAKADPNRIGQFIDAVFQEVYALPSSFRVWVVEL